jgi:hypothetical protein
MSWTKLGFIGIFMSFWTSPSCQARSKALSMSRKSVLLQIGVPGGVRVKLKDGVDGGAFRPESELLRWEEVLILRQFFRRVERVGSFPGLDIMTVVACFQARGKCWARMQLLKIAVRATMAVRGRFLKYGGFKFVGPRGFSAFQQLDVRFHLVRKNLDEEKVVFREEAKEMVGGGRDGSC